MKEIGLSQAELARRVGVTQPAIFALIHKNKTGSKNLHAIARALMTTPAWLNEETDDPDSDFPADAISSLEREWIDLLREMEAADRKVALTVARALVRASGQETLHDPQQPFRHKAA